jgi:O-antigen ligase
MYRLFERAVALLVLLFSMQVLIGLLYPEMRELDPRLGNTDLRPGVIVMQAMVYLLLITVASPRLARLLGALGKIRLLTALFALAAVSMLWSIDPMLTFRRAIPLCAYLIAGVYFGERYSIDEFLQLLRWSFTIVITASFALYFIHPSYVLDPSHDMAWRGICVHKNSFGAYMVLSALLFAMRVRERFPLLNCSLCAASVLLVFLSHSATALVLGGVVLLSTLLWRLVKLPMIQLVPIGTVVAILLTPLTTWPPSQLLVMLGRDSSLTGRTNLWTAVMTAISRRPLLGYGYDAFWQGVKGESLQAAINAGWLPIHSHNGYLELALGLGIPGLALFGLIYISWVASALGYARRTAGATAFWPIAFAAFFAVQNVTDSVLLSRNELPCLLFVTTFAALKLEEYRNAQRKQARAVNMKLTGKPIPLHPKFPAGSMDGNSTVLANSPLCGPL